MKLKLYFFLNKFFNNEIFRLFMLSLLVIYTYQSFLNGNDLGATDAWYYHNFLHDVLDQIDHGIFPVYVGQGFFNYFGTTVSLAPYYYILGEFLHLITFKQLDTLYIQHLIVLFSAFSGAFITYYLLNKINTKNRWLAMTLAFFYISCPGVMSLIYSMDMYYSFTTMPFLPLLFYGMIRNHQCNDIKSLLIICISLALLCSAHLPIAEWCSIILILFFGFKILFYKNTTVPAFQLFFIGFVLFFINLWLFTSMFSLKSHHTYITDQYPDRIKYTINVLQLLKDQFPDVFLPLSPLRKGLYFLQLGYSLWLLLLTSLTIYFFKKHDFIINIFLLIICFFLIMLFPPPFIGYLLWSWIPGHFRLVNGWPNQRLYLLLAALICFSSFLIINKLSFYIQQFLKTTIAIVLLGISWNIHEINYFKTHFLTVNQSKSYLKAYKQILFPFYRQPIHNNIFHGNYDPLLKTKLLDHKKNQITGYDFEQILNFKCLKHQLHFIQSKHFPLLNLQAGKPAELTQFNIKPHQKYLICLTGDFDLRSFMIEVYGTQFDTASLTLYATPAKATRNLLLPLYADENSNDLKLIILPWVDGSLKISSIGIVPYDDSQLPIQIESIIPFTAKIRSDNSGNYLELFKEYLPGYEAKVNGKKVSVLPSPRQFVMVPLDKGINQVMLHYEGTFLMHITFYISFISWLILISYLIFIQYRQSNLNTYENKTF